MTIQRLNDFVAWLIAPSRRGLFLQAFIFFIALAPIVALAYINYITTANNLTLTALKRRVEIAQDIAQALNVQRVPWSNSTTSIQMDPGSLYESLARFRTGSGLSIFIADTNGRVFAPDHDFQTFPDYLGASVQVIKKSTNEDSGASVVSDPVAENGVVVAYAVIPSSGWTVITGQSYTSVFAARDQALRRILFIDFIIVLIAILTAFLIVRIMNAINLYRQKERIFLESVADGLVAIDKNWNIMLWNRAATLLSGWHANEVYGKSIRDRVQFVEQKSQSADFSSIEQTLHSGAISTLKLDDMLVTKEGKSIPIGHSTAPILDQTGNVAGAIIVFRDITAEKELEQAKTEFVSLVSHQLRTPLSAIGWYAELLLNGDAGKITADQKEYLLEIAHGNQRMVELINALLNTSRIELGTIAIEPEPTQVITIAESIVKELDVQIEEKKLSLTQKYSKDVPIINLDPKLTRIIFQNVLSNAVKYTPAKGKVNVKIEKRPSDILITVTDTGMGIPQSQQSKIFTKLFRADNVREQIADGTGLGLYIVKAIVERAGGKIWFESKENKGTKFFVTIPLSGMKPKEGTKGLTA